MTMVSMKTKDEVCPVEATSYGWGTCISLTEEQVEALGLKANPPKAGSSVGIRAIATIVTVTQDADADGDGDGVDVTLRLQITDMEVTPGATGSNAGAASMLYSGGD